VNEINKKSAYYFEEEVRVMDKRLGLVDRYGLLPEVPEHIVDKLLGEVEDFAALLKHDPEGARRSLYQEIDWLKERKDFLGKAVETSIDAALDLYSDKLNHRDWIDLQLLLLKGVLIVLQSIDEALKEKHRV
jgi:hypothetical protein